MPLKSKPRNAIVWSRPGCEPCATVKKLLDANCINYVERIVQSNTMEEFKRTFPAAKTVPQIILDDVFIGGLDALTKILNNANSS